MNFVGETEQKFYICDDPPLEFLNQEDKTETIDTMDSQDS